LPRLGGIIEKIFTVEMDDEEESEEPAPAAQCEGGS
jgi:hypothetical protein